VAVASRLGIGFAQKLRITASYPTDHSRLVIVGAPIEPYACAGHVRNWSRTVMDAQKTA